MKPKETPEDIKQREYKERTKSISAERMVSYELYALRLSIDALSENLGKRTYLLEQALTTGLAAIALAASTPEDNSAEVKAAIEKLHAAGEPLKEAVERNQPPM